MPTSFTTGRDRAITAGPEHDAEHAAEHVGGDPVDTEPTEPEPEPTEPEPTASAPRPEPPDDTDGSEEEHWNDEGVSWWAPHPVPPSYRDAT